MSIFDKSQRWLLSKAAVILIVLLILTTISTYYYWHTPEQSKWATLLGGFASGLLLVLIQFIFSWHDYIEREKLSLLGLKNVLHHKRDRNYYGRLIKKAKREIKLMGKTGAHFLEDFANDSGNHDEARYLTEALGRGVQVKFLLPAPKVLTTDRGSDTEIVKNKLNDLSRDFGGFEYRYFDHPPAHSIFVSDDDVIIGPFFPDLASMDTPAIHLSRKATLPQKYIEYFDAEWNRAHKNQSD